MIRLTFLLIGCLLTTGLSAQPTLPFVDSLVEEALSQFPVAGVAVGIVQDGKIVHARGYGLREVDKPERVDAHTNFAVASHSKAFTTAALALLVEEGKLSWDDKVRTHIPEFTLYDPYVTEHFTIRDLLSHRSGMSLGMGDLMIFPDGHDFTLSDILSSFRHFEPVSEFRTKFDYNNLLYLVAGEVIARVSGKPWKDFVRTRIVEPLGMDRSYTSIDGVKTLPNFATPHAHVGDALKPLPPYLDMVNGAAAGLYSNVDDMCRWMLLHLNEGRYGEALGQRLFSEASQAEMWRLHSVLPGRPGTRFYGYGLGWFLNDKDGQFVVSHSGGYPGMLSKTTLLPDLETGIVVLTNTSDAGGPLFSAITNTLVDHYLGKEDAGYTDRYAAFYENLVADDRALLDSIYAAAQPLTRAEADRYVGEYEDPWFGKVTVTRQGEKLRMHCVRQPKFTGTMHYYGATTFAVDWDYEVWNADVWATFQLDREGQAKSLRLEGISPNIDFSLDFQDLKLRRVEE